MAKKTYIGVNNTARQVQKMYVGINGIARKVKKGYVGVNGVARLFYRMKQGQITYYGQLSGSGPTQGCISLANNNYLLFANGMAAYYSGNGNDAVLAFNTSLTKTALTKTGYVNGAGAGVANYLIWGLGQHKNGTTGYSTINCVDNSLTDITITPATSSTGAVGMAGAASANNSVCYFAGGGSSSLGSTGKVHSYDSSLTLHTGLTEITSRRQPKGCSFQGYAVFGTESDETTINDIVNTIEAYDVSGTKRNITTNGLSVVRGRYEVATSKNYILYGGGMSYDSDNNLTSYNTVDVYNSSFTRLTAIQLSQAVAQPETASLDNFCIFASGGVGVASGGQHYEVNIFNPSLTRSLGRNLTYCTCLAGGAIGDYAVFGTGYADDANVSLSYQDVYESI